MIKANNLCECMQELLDVRRVVEYLPDYNVLAPNTRAEEGQMCMVCDAFEDNGHYEDYTWVSDIQIYRELYPINYCPICGKEIEYIRFNRLTKKN